MTCSRNLFKHLKNKYQTKTNKEMSQFDFQFIGDLMTFFLQKKKVIKFSLLIFIFHICANFKPKKEEMCI